MSLAEMASSNISLATMEEYICTLGAMDYLVEPPTLRQLASQPMAAQSHQQGSVLQIPMRYKRSRETSLSRLEKLPAELKTEICSYLDYKSVLNLSMTSRRLHRDIGPARCAASVKAEFLLRAQEFTKHMPTGASEFKDRRRKSGVIRRLLVKTPSGKYGNLACFRCNVVLAAEKFSQRQRGKSTGHRFCLKCGRTASVEALARGRDMQRRSRACSRARDSGEAAGPCE